MASGTRGPVGPELRTLLEAGSAVGRSDGELLDCFLAAAGAAAEPAFAALVERHGPMVWRVCRDVLRESNDADDAFQATFIVLARRAGAIRKIHSRCHIKIHSRCHICFRKKNRCDTTFARKLRSMEKLGVKSRADVIQFALRQGWLAPK